MRRTARTTRAPLAPLHDNSLRGDSPRNAITTAKAATKPGSAKGTNTAASKPCTAKVKLPARADADQPSVTQRTGSKPARKASPAKPRNNVQLVTTSAVASRSENLARIKQAVKKPAEPAAKMQPAQTSSAAILRNTISVRRQAVSKDAVQEAAAAALAKQGADTDLAGVYATAASAGAAQDSCATTMADVQTPVNTPLHHWQVPATPPSISALLGALETPASVNRDKQYLPAQQQEASATTVLGVGTPQSFSDVFDLDEVIHVCADSFVVLVS